ncbi:3-oxoacyl-ACP reductase [Clostridia bacterium]|nr:3-oxoacyl-ACP reductase [Clostridia bacterium]
MKYALVTGASRGIGRACAELFAQNGYTVYAGFLNTPIAPREHIIPIQFDVGRACPALDVDVLVNNAGIALIRPINMTTEDEWDRIMAVNLKSAYICVNAVLPHMIKRKNGAIINISSRWGLVGASCEVAYSASKAGLIGFTKALAKELEPSNIRVNAVAPGAVDTDMNRGLDLSDFRVIQPEEVAKAVLDLAHGSGTGTVVEP